MKKKVQKSLKPNVCAKCFQPKDTFTKLCKNCLHSARGQRYKSYGREDLTEEMSKGV